MKQLKEISRALTGTLQFIESHRAILEAESITRLTELAFFFIPLSFAATVFSMQVKGLACPVPIWSFIAFALSLSAFTYVLRLLVRSSRVHRRKAVLSAAVREYSSTPAGASIPNAAFLKWLLFRLGPAIGFAFALLSLIAPPLAVLWTRRPSSGLKIALTFVSLIAIVLIPMALTLKTTKFRMILRDGIDQNWIRSRFSKQKPGKKPAKSLKMRIVEWIAGRSQKLPGEEKSPSLTFRLRMHSSWN